MMQQILKCAPGVSLREVLPEAQFFSGNDVRITSCCSDARRVQPGDLFVALTGEDDDGHDHFRRAVNRGAAAVLAERLLPVDVPMCLVNDSREAHGRVCQSLAGNPSQKMQTIGVTGTNGKTTTSMLIAAMFEAARVRAGVTTSLGYCDLHQTSPAIRTTPHAPEMADWLSRMVANGCSRAVVEVSSDALADRRLTGVEFDAAVLTNLRRDHLDLHGSVLNYRRIKARLFEYLKPHGFAVINADDPASQFVLKKLDCPVMTFGMQNQSELTATVVERFAGEQTFLLHAGHETVPVRTRMVGDQHVYNCLAATAVGLVVGLDLPTIVRGLESLERIPGRLDRVECGQPFHVFVDYGRTPDTLAVALRTMRQVARGRVICVFGGSERDAGEIRAQLGRVVERGADLGIVTSVDSLPEETLPVAHDILDGYDRPARAHLIPDRTAAISWALSQARAGDAVLIAGKGYEDVAVVNNRLEILDDTNIVRSYLYQAAAR